MFKHEMRELKKYHKGCKVIKFMDHAYIVLDKNGNVIK